MFSKSGDKNPENSAVSLQKGRPGNADFSHSGTPDQHHNNDPAFALDFEASAAASDRVTGLSEYQVAKFIFCTPDFNLRNLRHCALKDGKKLLLPSRELRRGLIILDPGKLSHDQLEDASSADGFETPVLGRYVTLDQLQEDAIILDMFVTGSTASFRQDLSLLNKSKDISRLSWLILADRGILKPTTTVVSVVHDGQIEWRNSCDENTQTGCVTEATGMPCDYIASPERLICIEDATRPEKDPRWLDHVSDDLFHSMPPLQELKGMKLVEELMAGTSQEEVPSKQEPEGLTPEAQLGMDIVNRLLKGYEA